MKYFNFIGISFVVSLWSNFLNYLLLDKKFDLLYHREITIDTAILFSMAMIGLCIERLLLNKKPGGMK